MGLQYNFKDEQHFWTLGPTLHPILNLTPKNGIYSAFSFFSTGKFTSHLIANAKNPATIPSQLSFTNKTKINTKQLSVGWLKYLKGSADATKGWNLYSTAGLGILFGHIKNTFSISPDTTLYNIPVYEGENGFKRLTVDLAMGVEWMMAGDIYFYSEGRLWIPASDYPGKFMLVNNNAPFLGILSAGIRILF